VISVGIASQLLVKKAPVHTHGDDDGATFCGNQGGLRLPPQAAPAEDRLKGVAAPRDDTQASREARL
jgi:predicted small lipoprotein YifL